MPGNRQQRLAFLGLACLGIKLALVAPAAWAQKPPSVKQLVRMAETDKKNNRWEAALRKLKRAAARKPKNKKIAAALQEAANFLADRTATRAITLCNQLEIKKCEKEADLASSYASTQRVQEAQAKLGARKKEIQQRWNRVQQMISEGQLPEANAELENLTRFSYLLPNLASEKERLRGLRVNSFLEQASRQVAAQKWDAAMEAFSAALRLDPGNHQASRGIQSAKKEKKAWASFQQARNAFQSKAYRVAYEANQKALQLFPARPPYQDVAEQIASEWSKVLFEEARLLSSNPDSQKDNQRAFEALEWVRRLHPDYPGLEDEMRTVRLTLHSIYPQWAGEYEFVSDNSRIGISYAYYRAAQQANPGGLFAFGAKLRETHDIFARKRAVRILVNMQNISPAPPTFSEVVARRVKAVIQRLGLPDVKMDTLEEYQKNPTEDPQFVENRPDGKSSTVLFTAALTNYESENTGGDTPVEKPSKFISGQERMPNPAYEQLQAELRQVSLALASGKPGKRTKEGYTTYHLQMLQQQLTVTPREIERDTISDYTYQEFHMSVRALIRMDLEIRDMLGKQLYGSQVIETADQRSQIEIAGVRDKDVNHLINKPVRLPSAEQLLRQSERKALELLDDKVRLLVNQYLQRFYAEGEKALQEGRTEDALENFLCHWYFFRGRLEENQSRRIQELVKRAIGLDLSTSATVPAAL